MKTLSIIIIAGNESDMIKGCLKTCNFADEIIVYSNSTDNTSDIVKQAFPKVKYVKNSQDLQNFNFSDARNNSLKFSDSDWVLFIDADERVTKNLQDEVVSIISQTSPKFTNYDIPRANYFLGRRVRFGGNYPDYVKRLFLKSSFRGFVGKIHEQPQIEGEASVIKSDLLHFTHRDLNSMLSKSIKWTEVEANLMYKDNHPPVVWWRFYRMVFTKFWQRYISQQMWRDGIVGLISVIFEMYDTYMIYACLFELQLTKSNA